MQRREMSWQEMLDDDYEFEQILAEAVHRIGADLVWAAVEPFVYDLPTKEIPRERREKVALAACLAVKGYESLRPRR